MDQAIKKISTYSELQEEKKKLKEEIHYSKEQLLRSLQDTGSTAKSLVLKGVVLPAGIAGLAVAGVKAVQAIRHNHQVESQTVDTYATYDGTQQPGIWQSIKNNLKSNSNWYMRMLPVAVDLIRNYIANRKAQQESYQNQDLEDAELYPTESMQALPAGSR